MSSTLNSPLNRFLVTVVLIGAVLALGAYAYLTFEQANDWNGGLTNITVSGKGEVTSKPDIAQFSFGVRGEGADAATAQEKSGTIINELNAYLKEQGVEEKDIKTENYNLNPKYRDEAKPCAYGSYCPPGKQIIDGYEVSQTITVKVRAIDKAGTLLAGVGDKGATDISGLNFTVDDDEKLKSTARDIAIVDAKAQAEKLAKALGVKLVRMTSYYEDGPISPFEGGYGGEMMNAPMMEKSFDSVDVPAGENKTISNVTLMFEVK